MPSSNSKPCHNCRRRRLRCDRSWPTCHKCAVSGQECLGYGKVFVWTQAIDAQGNLKPSPARRTPLGGPPGAGAAADSGGVDTAASASASASGSGSGSASTGYFPVFPGPADPGIGSERGQQNNGADITDAGVGAALGSTRQQNPNYQPHATINTSGTAMSATPETDNAPALVTRRHQLPALGGLTDPLFQDLDRNSRYYLAHCK